MKFIVQTLSTVLLSVLKLLHPLFSSQFIFWSGKLTISEMRDSPLLESLLLYQMVTLDGVTFS